MLLCDEFRRTQAFQRVKQLGSTLPAETQHTALLDTYRDHPLMQHLSTRNAVIIGPSDTPFEDGTFRLVMHFEEQYPNKPPGVKFISTMFHPNVYATGELCLDILQNRWSPTYDVAAILTSVQSLLNDPNTSSPANVEASNLFRDNRREYVKRVRETVEKSWED